MLRNGGTGICGDDGSRLGTGIRWHAYSMSYGDILHISAIQRSFNGQQQFKFELENLNILEKMKRSEERRVGKECVL